MKPKTALLLSGSPKITRSASVNLGSLLLMKLEKFGYNSERINVNTSIRANAMNDLICKVNGSDVLIISSPLYVDSLPAPLISFLECYKNDNINQNKRLIAIINSGFPEPHQNSSAIEILRLFAKRNGFTWLGGFAIGGGGALTNADLNKTKLAKNIVSAFEESAICINEGKMIPASIIELGSKEIMPARLYTFFGQLGWILQSLKYKTTFRLWAKPYKFT